jgi:predicted transcriptional regulator
MPLIPAPPAAPDKDTLALRVDRELHDQLRAYAEFLGSTKEYIVTSALRRVFRHDKEFIAWQQARSGEATKTMRREDARTAAMSSGNGETQATPVAETQRRPAGGR